jgi:DNA-binding NtrC family response regulator
MEVTNVSGPTVGGCDQLVGSSAGAEAVYKLIGQVAHLSAFVLITGESGTGKELVARAIHNLGHRAKSPFVAVSCGAIPESLIEAELFGHEKGAFTGSMASRAGYFEQAGEGTLFLDEIGELSLNSQVKLLRVLQQKEFTRLGSSKPLPLRARVLFATHRNLKKMVETSTFRQDLYFRVNVMTIEVPALCERAEDIPILAEHFLKKYAAECGTPIRGFEPEAVELLQNYDWPGNIRELENAIQRAVIVANRETIGVADLPPHIHRAGDNVISISGLKSRTAGLAESFEERLKEYKVKLATEAVRECKGNKTLAAQKLNLSRAYLHRLIRTA